MPDPWEIPPIPCAGDASEAVIHEAIGAAICSWEQVEVRLSWLYAAFTGRTRENPNVFQEYGEPWNFKDRLTKLKERAREYFIKFPDQTLEGNLCKTLYLVRQFSPRCNEIAHSVVRWLHNSRLDVYRHDVAAAKPGIQYFLLPPDYAIRRWSEAHAPSYVYTSTEVLSFRDGFMDLIPYLDEVYWPLVRKPCR